MTKDDLKQYIKNLNLEQELQDILFELVDGASEVHQTLLNTIADVLDLQAEFYEKEAEILEEEAAMYDNLALQLDVLDEEEFKERMDLLAENHENLSKDFDAKIKELTGGGESNESPQTGNEDVAVSSSNNSGLTANASENANPTNSLQDLANPTS